MGSNDEKGSIDILQERLGANWDMIIKARASARLKRAQLREALDGLDSDDLSIVVFGSLARDELTSGSDIDWALLADGIANSEHWDNALEIGKHIRDIEKRKPGREGTFGGLMFSHDLIHKIGGEDDTNRNMTQRILLLWESAAIGRREAYERVVRNVLKRYVNEDYGLIYSAGPFNVPRFLQNDMARYWRTVAVDFAYKQRQRGDEGWALRTIKLRISRKLTYASGLLMCFSCEIDDPKPSIEKNQNDEPVLQSFVDHLWKYVHKSPLEIVADMVLRYPELYGFAFSMLNTYNDFLTMLDDDEVRQHLEGLPRDKVAGDITYERMRELSHDFQNSLRKLFLTENGTPLYELTLTYGVF